MFFCSYLVVPSLIFMNQVFLGVNAEPILVRVVKKTADHQMNINSIDFMPISNRLLEQRANSSILPAEFTGPELLRPLLNSCFLYEDNKYVFRVCPFANVTQHEKSQYAFNFLTTSFHAILGIWREWYITNNTFDSLLYMHGDQCDQTTARKVRVYFQCSNDWTMTDLAYVKNVTEIEKCFYKVELSSSLFCELGSVYSRMDEEGKMEWDVLETIFHNGDLTPQGYEHYLQLLLRKYGLETSEWNHSVKDVKNELNDHDQQVKSNQSEIDLCKNKLEQLEKENAELKLLLQIDASNKTIKL